MDNNKFEKRILFAFKLGKKDFMESFFIEGLIYMNSVAYFKNLSKKGQGDKYEGAELIRKGLPVKYRDNIEKEKVFCMWHINNFTEPMGSGVQVNYYSDTMCEMSIDTRLYVDEFADGDYEDLRVVAIHNLKEFHSRLRNAYYRNNIKQYDMGEIRYYNLDKTTNITVDKYMKPNAFKHQNEIRYYVEDTNNAPLLVKIGSISDIASIHKVCLIKIKLPYSFV